MTPVIDPFDPFDPIPVPTKPPPARRGVRVRRVRVRVGPGYPWYSLLTRPATGVRPRLMHQLYPAVALPRITYGVDIWYTPPSKPTGSTCNKGSVGILRNLQKIQLIATLAITGTLRSSPNDYVDIHARVLPMDLALLKACHNAVIRSLTLPHTNPIHQVMHEAQRRPPSTHLGPLNRLLELFKLRQSKFETIQPAITINRTINFSTFVDSTREDSITSESNDDADFKVFSDGSGLDNGIGAAAIMYEKGRVRPIKSLQAFLGTPDKHNTYEAEAIGAILALWIMSNTPETIGRRVTLYIDNQSIVKAILEPKATSGQYLLSALRMAANGVGCRLSVRWISSHSKVKGNEDVDKLAKKAAEGRSSARARLPHILRGPLPISASAHKQHFNSSLKTKWSTLWDTSPRKTRIAQFGEDFPFSAFLKRLDLLTRKQSSIILQLRCGHFPLNVYLHRIGKSETNSCQACLDDEEGQAHPETINHFIFDCPAYKEAREELVNDIDRDNLHFIDIMANTNYMKALTTFINRTRRFRD